MGGGGALCNSYTIPDMFSCIVLPYCKLDTKYPYPIPDSLSPSPEFSDKQYPILDQNSGFYTLSQTKQAENHTLHNRAAHAHIAYIIWEYPPSPTGDDDESVLGHECLSSSLTAHQVILLFRIVMETCELLARSGW